MSDEFFANLDSSLNQQAEAREVKNDETAKAVDFAERVVPSLLAYAKKMATGLRERGITAEVQGGGTVINFKMAYANGDRHDLYFGLDRERGGFELRTYHVGEDGRSYNATPGGVHRETNWDEKVFTEALDRHVRDYITYAPRHRGIA